MEDEHVWTVKEVVARPPPDVCLRAFLAQTPEYQRSVIGDYGMDKVYQVHLPRAVRNTVHASWFNTGAISLFRPDVVVNLIEHGIVQNPSKALAYRVPLTPRAVDAVRDNFSANDASWILARVCAKYIAETNINRIDRNTFDLALQGVLPQHVDDFAQALYLSIMSDVTQRFDFIIARGLKPKPELLAYHLARYPSLGNWIAQRNFDMFQVREAMFLGHNFGHTLGDKCFITIGYTSFEIRPHELGPLHGLYGIPTRQAFNRAFFHIVGPQIAPAEFKNVLVLLQGKGNTPVARFVRRDGDNAILRRVASCLDY